MLIMNVIPEFFFNWNGSLRECCFYWFTLQFPSSFEPQSQNDLLVPVRPMSWPLWHDLMQILQMLSSSASHVLQWYQSCSVTSPFPLINVHVLVDGAEESETLRFSMAFVGGLSFLAGAGLGSSSVK